VNDVTNRLSLFFFLTLAAFPAMAGWQAAGPFGGSATSVALHPANPETMLVGARNSLIFQSKDGGLHWQRLPFPRLFLGTVSALLIDQDNPRRYYAALNNDYSAEAGVWISEDAGETWRRPESLGGLSVHALAQWAKDPRRMVAGTRDGVWLSDDAGETWRRISKPYNHELRSITAVAIDPADKRVIYAGTTHLPWKTKDEGATWSSIHNGMVDDSDVFSIYIDPRKPERVFASACSGIYLSNSAGESWSKVRGIPGTHRRTHVIRLHPKNPNVIYAGTTLGLLKSTDAGVTFRKLNDLHILSLAFDPRDPEKLWLAAEGSGLWFSSTGGQKIERSVRGFVNRRVVDAAWAGDRAWVNTVQDGDSGGVYFSEDGGRQWELAASGARLGDQHLHLLAADPNNPGLVLAGNERRLLRTLDGGKTWKPVVAFPPGYKIQALAATLRDESTVFLAGTDKGLLRSTDQGSTWRPVPLTLAKIVPDVKSIRISPRGSRAIARTGHTLYLSGNAGETWWTVPVLVPTSTIYDIALGDEAGDPILLATARGMLRSEDGGKHWSPATDGLEEGTVSTVAFRPDGKSVVYAAQFGRVFLSEDAGKTWRPLPGASLPEATIRRLWFHPRFGERLLALTPDLGVFYLDLTAFRVHNR
jgi:photosystem II stability/assembly factor-like uncharacterized protein